MKSFRTHLSFLNLAVLSVFIITACGGPQEPETPQKWVGTWSTALQLTEPRNNPPEPGLNGNTIRQVVHVSLGGERLRFRVSNVFGTKPVSITEIRIAQSAGNGAIVEGTETILTFEGEKAITLPPDSALLSDPFDFDLAPLSDVAVTMYISSIGEEITGHPGSRTTSYILEGNTLDQTAFTDAVTTDHWYIIDALDVLAPDTSVAIALLGDSITDGRGSGTNKQNRWPDELARRLQANPGTGHIAILNQGIGGNCVLRPCLGPAALDRFERDVLNQTGVKYLVILEGVNDIGGIQTEEEAREVAGALLTAYEEMIDKAHEQNILVYGATIMPFGDSFYYREASELARQMVNEWIRASGAFDAVIDLDQALEDPDNPGRLLPAADDGDHLHPSQEGHRLMAEAVDLSLFLETEIIEF